MIRQCIDWKRERARGIIASSSTPLLYLPPTRRNTLVSGLRKHQVSTCYHFISTCNQRDQGIASSLNILVRIVFLRTAEIENLLKMKTKIEKIMN